jgi:hypothetical protein
MMAAISRLCAHAYGPWQSRCSAPVAAASPSDCGASIGSASTGRLRIAAAAGRLAMHKTLPGHACRTEIDHDLLSKAMVQGGRG